MNQGKLEVVKQEMARGTSAFYESVDLNVWLWVNLTQRTTMSTAVGKNPLEDMEQPS